MGNPGLFGCGMVGTNGFISCHLLEVDRAGEEVCDPTTEPGLEGAGDTIIGEGGGGGGAIWAVGRSMVRRVAALQSFRSLSLNRC